MKIHITALNLFKFFGVPALLIGGFILGFFANSTWNSEKSLELLNPFVAPGKQVSYPLLKYTIKNLQTYPFQTSNLVLEKVIAEEPSYTSFIFSYTTLERRMTGQINIPDSVTANPEQKNKVIIMLRGYVPPEIYTTGVGTKNVGAAFAEQGYITVAPDFFGYGDSDPVPENSWITRFEKPIAVIELLNSIRTNGIPLDTSENLEALVNDTFKKSQNIDSFGIWAHSNGGQIALTSLEILRESIPTTLWAPVTAPFPYSIQYFSDELEDEGKSQRKWIALFEEEYDVFEFSLTQHLEDLSGPIQIQHGDSDDAALIYWSQEFVDKVTAENERRKTMAQENSELAATTSARQASVSANIATNSVDSFPTILNPIEINLITYPNTNHNMVPNWNTAVQRDLQFFDKWLE